MALLVIALPNGLSLYLSRTFMSSSKPSQMLTKISNLSFIIGLVDGCKQGVSIIGTSKLSADNAYSVITRWLANKDKQCEEASQLLQKVET